MADVKIRVKDVGFRVQDSTLRVMDVELKVKDLFRIKGEPRRIKVEGYIYM